ncbi:hypothetical protein NC651_018052 [Populus alba x Populus x berolinensis]|nr:hypothetical protein NC651_018052 [Populus alba x Populus x berolinensis]
MKRCRVEPRGVSQASAYECLTGCSHRKFEDSLEKGQDPSEEASQE